MTTIVDHAMLWHAALGRMPTMEAPCPGITAIAWPAMKARAMAFLEAHGAQTVTLGWTVADLLGVHPTRGTIRVDDTGALLFSSAVGVRDVLGDRIVFEGHRYFRDVPGRGIWVPVWEYRS